MDISTNATLTPIAASASLPSSFKQRRIGRCPSPPIWGCYELEVHDSDSDNESNSDSEDEALSIVIAEAVDPANIPLPPSPTPVTIAMGSEPTLLPQSTKDAESNDSPTPDPVLGDATQSQETHARQEQTEQSSQRQEDACNDCTQPRLDKGKGREIVVDSPPEAASSAVEESSPQTPASRLSRPIRLSRPSSRSQRREPKYQPILTIRSSHGWIWNQDLFVPHYMKDRYISYPPEPPSSDNHGMELDCIGITLTPEDLTQVLPP